MYQHLQDWLDPQQQFNQLSFVWLSSWSGLIMALVSVIILITLWLGWHNTQKLSIKRRSVLFSLRLCVLGLFFLLFLQPAARLEEVARVKNHVAVILDTSKSMSLPQSHQNDAKSRLEQGHQSIISAQKTLKTWSKKDHHIDYFSLDAHLNTSENQQSLLSEKPFGAQTSIINALNELSTRIPTQDLAAVILISDGGEWTASGQVDPPLKLMSAVEHLKVPIHTLALGPEEPTLDLALSEVRADDFAFARNVVSVDVDIIAHGTSSSLSCRVTLTRGQELLSERILDLSVGQNQGTIRFEFVPEETGEESYTVKIDPVAGEQIIDNNLTRFSMRVIRDKIRVLQVVGNPSWDQRFLRKHLKKNPNVDLISFFILRTNASLEVARPEELSLIPFPTQELFEERLDSFDLMIFQDFTYKGYRMGRYLPLIRDYVKRGGGFMMIGGNQSFSGGMYAGTAIEDILPFNLRPNGRKEVELGTFRPTLSAIGKRHPITALSLSSEENHTLWKQLPALEGINRVGSLKSSAQVLAWRPAHGQNTKSPLMVASPIGKGRSLAITTDSLWRWAISPEVVNSDLGARAYHRLWSNAIRWLIRDPALNPLQVKADRDSYRLNDQLSIHAQSLNQAYQPIAGARIELSIEDISAGTQNSVLVKQHQGVASDSGELHFSWKVQKEGVYRIVAQSSYDGIDRQAYDLFVVAEDLLELRDPTPRPDLLKAISRVSGGQVIDIDSSWAELNRLPPVVNQINRREDFALWATWWALCLALLFPSVEWALRRRWGLS